MSSPTAVDEVTLMIAPLLRSIICGNVIWIDIIVAIRSTPRCLSHESSGVSRNDSNMPLPI